MLSWISTRLHQDTGRFWAAWLGTGEVTTISVAGSTLPCQPGRPGAVVSLVLPNQTPSWQGWPRLAKALSWDSRLAPRAKMSNSAPLRLSASDLALYSGGSHCSNKPAAQIPPQNLNIFIVPSKHLEFGSITSWCHKFDVWVNAGKLLIGCRIKPVADLCVDVPSLLLTFVWICQ